MSFIGTLLISASMLCSTFVFGRGHRAPLCVSNGARLARMLGPAAWQAVDHCPVPPAARTF